MKSPGRILIVSPRFHGYWESITAAFSQLGYDVAACRYDDRSTLDKVAHKLTVELPQRLGLDRESAIRGGATRAAIGALRADRPDVVLVVKGDLLGDDFHEEIANASARSAVWIYDELANTRFTTDDIARFHGVASYSRRDTESLRASGIDCLHTPDAFDPNLDFVVRPSNDIVHVGARYPARVDALEALHEAGVPVRSYGREWSRHPYDLIRTWGASRPTVPGGREVPRSEAQGLMAGAPATVNIHGSHDGFNMRTFEAAGAGAVQLIDRSDVDELYEPGVEILPFGSHAELIELSRRAIRDDRWGDRIREAARARTLAEHTFLHRARHLETLWA